MFKRNWREIEPRLEYKGTCYVRDFFRRKDKLALEGGFKVTEYLEWVRRTTIPAGKKLLYHKQNLDEALYILQGEGAIQVGEEIREIKAWDAVYIPTETPHTVYSTVDNQPLIYMDYAVRTPPDAEEIRIEETSIEEDVKSSVRVGRWSAQKGKPGHNGTCWTYSIFTRNMMQYLLFATMMSVPRTLGYHRHNTEAIYYVESGAGFIKVGGQEAEIQAGDAIYIPNSVAHRCTSTLKDQPLNVFCLGVAIPYDAQVWTEEDLPDAPI